MGRRTGEAGGSEREFVLWLYQDFHRLMFYTARKYVADPKQQEDVVQESLRKLMERAPHLRRFSRNALAGYVAATVRNAAIDDLKARQEEQGRLVRLDGMSAQADPRGLELEDALILREDQALLRRIWPKLAEETRIALKGKYVLEYSDEEIARLLGCKPSSVRMRLTRARREARELMYKEGKKRHEKP